MSFGMGGQSSHSRSTSTTTTTNPFSQLIQGMMGTVGTAIKGLVSGQSISEGVNAIKGVYERTTKEGTANIKEAMGRSGLRFSTDTGKAIGDFVTGQTTAEARDVTQFQQGAVQNQLAAIQEIIQMAAGTGTSTTTGAQSGGGFGWNFAMKLIGGQ